MSEQTKTLDNFVKSLFFENYRFCTEELTAQFVFEYLDLVHSSLPKNKEWIPFSFEGVKAIEESLRRLENDGLLDSKTRKSIPTQQDDIGFIEGPKRIRVYYRRPKHYDTVFAGSQS